MRVIIAGSRTIDDIECIVRAVEESGFEVTEVVSGTAKGVDQTGEKWARAIGIPIKKFPANWKPGGVFDRSAGYKRNVEMGEYGDALIAVWDGISKGTNHMINIMESMGKPVYVYKKTKWGC